MAKRTGPTGYSSAWRRPLHDLSGFMRPSMRPLHGLSGSMTSLECWGLGVWICLLILHIACAVLHTTAGTWRVWRLLSYVRNEFDSMR